jgi:hypothetical protein
MLEIARLPTHSNSCIQIKWQLVRAVVVVTISVDGFPARFGLDEGVEAGDVFEFGVSVKKEGGVICVGEAEGMEFLEICDEVVDTLRVQEL